MHRLINIKGGRDGLRIVMDEDVGWDDILTALQEQLEQGGSFFSGARMVVEIGGRRASSEELSAMVALMKQYGLQPEALATTESESRRAARTAGLTPRDMPQVAPVAPSAQGESESTCICRTIRSGQVVRHQGHITLIGDVNPGAEVIAGGNIVVWGRLRGLVHAGALGDTGALVCALDLRPTQLRIANLIARTPDDSRSSMPEIARIDQEHIIVEAWDDFKR